MKKDAYYTSGQFAKKAHVTLRAIRYYDKQNILKPSARTAAGARLYTDADLAKLQQILLLKYLGFSLEDIREMTLAAADQQYLLESMRIQKKLLRQKMDEMQAMDEAIDRTIEAIQTEQAIDWNSMLDLIHLTAVERSLKNQYQNASNISSRIYLHSLYSVNQEGWFPWICQQCQIHEGMNILELGCGDGALWTQNLSKLPGNIHITLSDISEGMLRDARRAIGGEDPRFSFKAFDCHSIPPRIGTFDLVIANHVLFYCDDIGKVCKNVTKILKPGGRFLCSTYGSRHMREVSLLVQSFDERIALSADKLYERFGRENGTDILSPYFQKITWKSYEDELIVTDAEPLISYILSCHGNQNQYLPDRYKDFRALVKKKTENGFHITKDAGVFLCEKVTNLK